MLGFEESDRRQNKLVEIANKSPKGIGVEQLVPGALITVSPNKANGDRSYTNDVLEVLSSNASHVIVKMTGLMDRPWFDGARVLLKHEHEFYPAEHLAEAIREQA